MKLKNKLKNSLIMLLSISLLLLGFLNIFPQSVSAATITATSNTPGAVQTAINSAVDGDTVVIPNGSVAWSSGVTISGKGIHLKGQTKGSMVITFNASGSLITASEDTTHRVEISDLKFVSGSNQTDHTILINETTGGKAVLIHDNDWYGPHLDAIRMQTRRGVIYNNTMNTTVLNEANGGDTSFVQCKCQGSDDVASWYTADTMGTHDTTGENNLYIEDNYLTDVIHQAIDFDDNSRIVVRYNTFDNSAMASHGPDTSNYGVRHFEVYNNTFIFTPVAGDYTGSQTANLDNFLFLRGGTGVITDNAVDDINSSAWGNKSEFKFTVMMPWRAAGPFGGWDWTLPNVTVDMTSHSICGYPVPRQIGTTWTGSGSGETSAIASDPVYIWNNTGAGNMTPSFEAYTPNECGSSGASQTIDQYLQMGRDVKAQARPNYTKYTYPHPLRSGGGPTPTPGPTSTPTPTPAATSTPTPTPASTPTPTPTPASTPTPTPTPASTPTPTPTPVSTPTPTPTPTSTPTPTPGGWTRVQETGTGVSYDGVGWTTYSDANYSGGTIKRTGNGHEYAFFTFTGTGVRWYDKRDTDRGKCDVYIDSVKQTTIDCYGTASYVFKMYEKTGLSSGSHTLKLDTTGTKNASSSGTRVGVDCFEYTN